MVVQSRHFRLTYPGRRLRCRPTAPRLLRIEAPRRVFGDTEGPRAPLSETHQQRATHGRGAISGHLQREPVMAKAVVLSIKNHVKRAEPAKRRRRAAGEKSAPAVAPLA